MEWFILAIVVYIIYVYGKKKRKPLSSEVSEYKLEADYSYFRQQDQFEKSINKSSGKWIAPSEKIEINGKLINGGLFYFGGILEGRFEGDTESSLVDDSFSIENMHYTFSDDSLRYWPSYNSLSPQCRGAYIDWLASGRDMKDVPIGYLFLYFYGLERRIIKEYKAGLATDEECIYICAEVVRLQKIFKNNHSFNSYSTNLLEYISIQYPHIFSIPDDEIQNSINSNAFKEKLARVIKNNEPLPPDLAYAWVSNHPDHSLRTPARRCPEEFKALFIRRYKASYLGGLIVKPNKTSLKLRYYPASGSLDQFGYGPTDLCDPSVLSAPVKKLASIANECTDELDAYSRYLGKKGTSKEDINAIVLLPKELIDMFDIQLVKEFKSWVENVTENEGGICDFKDLWQQTKLLLPEKVNKKEQELVCKLIEKSGYSLAPHPTLHGSKFNSNDSIVIYKKDPLVQLENSAVFDDVSIKLRLGTIIANADLKIHSNEVSFLQNIIRSNDNLTSHEKLSLEAYLKWLLNSSSNFNGLKASLSRLRDDDKEVVRKMLINVALSDGKIDPSEVKEIEKLYTTLGLNKSTVPADIHALSYSRKGSLNKVGNVLATAEKKQSFALDESVLDVHETETKAAQNILKSIFRDEDEADSEEDLEIKPEATLENKALAIYKIISYKERVERTKFEKICSEHGFFVDAAIDSINEWAFDKVSAPVIEEDTDIIIDREIVDELKDLGDI